MSHWVSFLHCSFRVTGKSWAGPGGPSPWGRAATRPQGTHRSESSEIKTFSP